ncbi:hypothetical protein [Streptomyces sp. NPDC093109]|uniref:hypothetical protein n=1 Tax=Streptomyces sp. NPDC093109 TaxID=3154977 RepID=UPI00344C4668
MTCSKCRRPYALDPKGNALGLHDLRVLRLVQKLSGDGQLSVSVSQLWFAASRRTRQQGSDLPGTLGCSAVAVVVGCGLIALGVSIGEEAAVATAFGGLFLVGTVIALIVTAVGRSKRREALPYSHFRSSVMGRWMVVYGALPAGVVDERVLKGVVRPERPAAVLLCPDTSIAAFLVANGVPQRYGLALVTEVGDVDVRGVPGEAPVIVLHHADPFGCRLPGLVRDALPGRRVVDAGMPPRSVMNTPKALPLRGEKPRPEVVAALRGVRATGALTDAEVAWLADGYTGTLAAVPPVKLLATVTRVVERVTAAPELERARDLGFLSWPGEGAA